MIPKPLWPEVESIRIGGVWVEEVREFSINDDDPANVTFWCKTSRGYEYLGRVRSIDLVSFR